MLSVSSLIGCRTDGRPGSQRRARFPRRPGLSGIQRAARRAGRRRRRLRWAPVRRDAAVFVLLVDMQTRMNPSSHRRSPRAPGLPRDLRPEGRDGRPVPNGLRPRRKTRHPRSPRSARPPRTSGPFQYVRALTQRSPFTGASGRRLIAAARRHEIKHLKRCDRAPRCGFLALTAAKMIQFVVVFKNKNL